MRNVVFWRSTRFKIFCNFWVLLGSWATVLKHFGAQQRKSKWCKALSSAPLHQVARRAEIQDLTKHVTFTISFKLLSALQLDTLGCYILAFPVWHHASKFWCQMSKMTINRRVLKWKTCFLEGSPNEDFLQFLGSPTVLGHSFEAFRRAAAQSNDS